jgi:sirohydrochlorin ferrochelatase
MSPDTIALLIGHGSPDPRHAAALRTLTTEVDRELAKGSPSMSCEIAFLDHDQPQLGPWLEQTAHTRVRVVGLLLGAGYHARIDVPRVLDQAPGHVTVENLGTLGHGAWLFAVLDHLVTDAGGDQSSPVVMTAAGSTDEHARADVHELCTAWQRTRRGPVLVATLTGPDPRPHDVLTSVDPAEAIVVPLLLAPGALADRAVEAAAAAGARVTRTLTTAEASPHELVGHLAHLLRTDASS